MITVEGLQVCFSKLKSMVFHGEHPFDSKISFIGKRQKKGHTYRAHQIGVEEGLVNAAAGLDDLNPAAEPDPAEPPPVKKNGLTITGEFLTGEFQGGFSLLRERYKNQKQKEMLLFWKERGFQRGMLL